jgi:riboflavin kinase/FMN adenylyltransferase
MKVVYGRHNMDSFQKATGVGLGNFDGLHLGHMGLVNALIDESKKNCLSSVVYTFSRHPYNILKKENFTPILSTIEKKKELLGNTSLDYICIDEFDEKFSKMSPEEFVKKILIDTLKAKLAVVGFDYRFGYMGRGDAYMLRELGEKYNLRVKIIPSIKVDDEVISSTLIRAYITEGNMEKVTKLLGRYYSIKGTVKEGRRVGSQLGFPTANIYPVNNLALPKYGVYITKTFIADRCYESITNVGRAPTFGQHEKISIETYVFDFEQNLYNTEIEIFFISHLREEKKFNGVEELVAQVKEDILEVKKYFHHNMSIE